MKSKEAYEHCEKMLLLLREKYPESKDTLALDRVLADLSGMRSDWMELMGMMRTNGWIRP